MLRTTRRFRRRAKSRLNKNSDLLTASADKAATPILSEETPPPQDLNTLEQSAKTLGEALTDNPTNQKGAGPGQGRFEKTGGHIHNGRPDGAGRRR